MMQDDVADCEGDLMLDLGSDPDIVVYYVGKETTSPDAASLTIKWR